MSTQVLFIEKKQSTIVGIKTDLKSSDFMPVFVPDGLKAIYEVLRKSILNQKFDALVIDEALIEKPNADQLIVFIREILEDIKTKIMILVSDDESFDIMSGHAENVPGIQVMYKNIFLENPETYLNSLFDRVRV